MRPILEFWLSLSRLNRIAIDSLLFWLAAGSVVGWGAMAIGAAREFVIPFLALTILAGVLGTLVGLVELIRRLRERTRLRFDEPERRQRNRLNLRVSVLLIVANAFPAFVLGLAWMRGIRLYD